MFRFLKRTSDGAPGAVDPARAALLRILELNKEMARATRPETLPDRILDAAIELAGAERGFLIERRRAPADAPAPAAPEDENAEEGTSSPDWEVVAARNIDRENVRKGLRKVSRSITARVLETGEAFRSDDAINDESIDSRASIAELKLRSVLCVPLRVGEEVRGCLHVDNRFAQGQFDAGVQDLLEAFADQAALALERVHLLAENEAVRGSLEQANSELKDALHQQAAALDTLAYSWRGS